MQKVFDSSDAVMLTETWTNDFSNTEVNNFVSFVLNRKEQKKNVSEVRAVLFYI